MTDPERLLSSTEDDFERRILRTARCDVGSEESLRRTLGALRVAAGAGAGVAAASAAAAAPIHGGGAGAAGAASIGKILGFVAIGAVAGTLATGGTAWVLGPARPVATVQKAPVGSPSLRRAPKAVANRTDEAAEARAADPGAGDVTAGSVAGDVTAGSAAGNVARSPLASLDPKPNDVRGKTASSPSSIPEASALTSELATLEGVRSALDRDRPALALELLDTYEHRFPNGVLRPEAVVLRIDALAKMGDRTTASGLARRFLASHPGTPHAAHLQALIAERRK